MENDFEVPGASEASRERVLRLRRDVTNFMGQGSIVERGSAMLPRRGQSCQLDCLRPVLSWSRAQMLRRRRVHFFWSADAFYEFATLDHGTLRIFQSEALLGRFCLHKFFLAPYV